MIEEETLLLLLVLLVGVTVILAILLKAALERISIPPLVGHLLLGMAMGLLNSQVYFLIPLIKEVYAFLAELGIISLLFRVGLESNLAGLIRQLPRASFILFNRFNCDTISFKIEREMKRCSCGRRTLRRINPRDHYPYTKEDNQDSRGEYRSLAVEKVRVL